MSDDGPRVESGDEILWQLATALSRSFTMPAVTAALVQAAAPAAGGVSSSLAVHVHGSDEVSVVTSSPLGSSRLVSRCVDVSSALPPCDVLRSGLPVLLGSLEDVRQRFPDALGEMLSAGTTARATLPLQASDGETLGALDIEWQHGQAFETPQLRRLDLVAQLAAPALERALRHGSDPSDERELGRALETLPQAYLAIDTDFYVTHVNLHGATLLGSTAEALRHRHLFDVFPEAEGTELELQSRRSMQRKSSVVFEEYYARMHSWFEVHVWTATKGVNVLLHDVGDRHHPDRTLQDPVTANVRLRVLTDVAERLVGADSRTEVFQRLTHIVAPAVADWCTIVTPEENGLVRVAARHVDPALDELAQRLVGAYPHAYSGPSPGVVVYRNNEPLRLDHLVNDIVKDLDDSFASAAYGRTLQLLGDGPGLIVPVSSNEQVQAVITMVRCDGDVFTDDDVALMTDVASRVASALDSADDLHNQRMTAHALQAAALPSSLPSSESLRLAAGYRAASNGAQVGGDWYDAIALGSTRIVLSVGDVAGHGIAAAALAAKMRNSLRAHLFAGVGPLESLIQLNQLVATQEPDAMATIICVEIDTATGAVAWASAGHPAPIVVSNNGTSAYLQGRPIPPIGSANDVPGDRQMEHRFTIRPGNRLILFTDGLIERRSIGLDIGLAHLMILAEQTRAVLDLKETCDAILGEMLPPSHGDDACLLIADFVAVDASGPG